MSDELLQAMLKYVLPCLALASIALNGIIDRLLRLRHPRLWAELGKPSLFRRRGFRQDLKPMRFLYLGTYRSLEDVQLRRLCDVSRVFGIATLGLGTVVVAYLFAAR